MAQAPGRALRAPCGVRSHRDGAGGCEASCRGGLSRALLEWLRATNPGTSGPAEARLAQGPPEEPEPTSDQCWPLGRGQRGECRLQDGCTELSRSASVQRLSPPTSGPDLEPCAPEGRLPLKMEKSVAAPTVPDGVQHCAQAHAECFTHTSCNLRIKEKKYQIRW